MLVKFLETLDNVNCVVNISGVLIYDNNSKRALYLVK